MGMWLLPWIKTCVGPKASLCSRKFHFGYDNNNKDVHTLIEYRLILYRKYKERLKDRAIYSSIDFFRKEYIGMDNIELILFELLL